MKCYKCGAENPEDADFCMECGNPIDGSKVLYDVFMSYSANDKNVADAITASLESKNIRCWIAPRDIEPGADWGRSIVNAIHNSQIMVLIFSSNSNHSPQVLREVERAVSNGNPIIPFRIEDIEPSKSMEYFISATHWLDALTPPIEKHIKKLTQLVVKLINVDENDYNEESNHNKQNLIENDDEWDITSLYKTLPPWLLTIFKVLFIFFVIIYGGFFYVYVMMYITAHLYVNAIILFIVTTFFFLESFFAKSTNNYLKKWVNLKPYKNVIILILAIAMPVLMAIFGNAGYK